MDEDKAVRILYTNYRDETNLRRIIPKSIFHGSSNWHKEPQWLLEAFDIQKDADRHFAMKYIRAWLAD